MLSLKASPKPLAVKEPGTAVALVVLTAVVGAVALVPEAGALKFRSSLKALIIKETSLAKAGVRVTPAGGRAAMSIGEVRRVRLSSRRGASLLATKDLGAATVGEVVTAAVVAVTLRRGSVRFNL